MQAEIDRLKAMLAANTSPQIAKNAQIPAQNFSVFSARPAGKVPASIAKEDQENNTMLINTSVAQ